MNMMRLISKTIMAAGVVAVVGVAQLGSANAADNWDNETWDQYRRMMAEQEQQSGSVATVAYKEPVARKEWNSADGNVTVLKSGAGNTTMQPVGAPRPVLASAPVGNTTAPMGSALPPASTSNDRSGERAILGLAALPAVVIIALGIAALL